MLCSVDLGITTVVASFLRLFLSIVSALTWSRSTGRFIELRFSLGKGSASKAVEMYVSCFVITHAILPI